MASGGSESAFYDIDFFQGGLSALRQIARHITFADLEGAGHWHDEGSSALGPRNAPQSVALVTTTGGRREADIAEPQEEPPTASTRSDRLQERRTWWELAYFALSGKRFHKQRDRRGFCRANEVEGIAVCHGCRRAGQRPYNRVVWLYQDGVGHLHTDPRCSTVIGSMQDIRACCICGGSVWTA